MSFLHWSLLPLAGLAIIPVLLHLLTLHRLRTVELSTYRFLFDSYVQQRRQMKFLEALLAFLRTLFLLALVLVFCRPVIRHWDRLFGGGSGREVVLLLDASASMNARSAGRTALDRAKSAALAVARRLNKDDRLTLIRVGERPTEVFGRFSADVDTLREQVEAIEAGPARANFFAALSQVYGAEARRPSPPVVYILSDGQAVSWREVREQRLDRIVPEGAKITVVDVGGEDETLGNRGVVGDPPGRERAVLGLPIRLRPRVVNHSRTESAELTVGLVLDDKEVARVPFSLRPGETATKEIIHIPTEAGVVRGRFEIGMDRFPDDDTYLFALHVMPQLKVLLVNGHPAADPFEDESFYIRTALSATVDDDSPTVARADSLGPGPEFVRALDVREVPEGQLSLELLRTSHVVLLLNCGGLNGDQFQWLREFVRAGGGLLILPGDRVNPEAYTRQFFPVPGQPGETLTAVELGPAEGDPAKRESILRLASVDFAHPAFSVFDEPEHHYLTTAMFFRRLPLKLAGSHSGGWALARFGNGTPALVENHFGTGLVILAGFPGTARWSNLPLKPEFVPLVLRLVSYASQAPDLAVPSTVEAEGAAEIAVAGTWAPAVAKVVDPRGRTSPVSLERSASRLMGQFEDTGLKGYYAVEASGGRLEPPQAAASAFAVNTAAEESNFQTVGEAEIRQWLPSAQLGFVDASSQAEQEYGSPGEEREIWRPMILLLFGIIGIEFFLATMTGHRGTEGTSPTLLQRLRGRGPRGWIGGMTGADHE
jgi:hypothetical protein